MYIRAPCAYAYTRYFRPANIIFRPYSSPRLKNSIEPVRYRCTMVDRVIVVTPRCLACASRMPDACGARACRVLGVWQEHAWCSVGHGDLLGGRARFAMGVNELIRRALMHYRRVARIVLFSTRWPQAASRAARACTVNARRKPGASSVSRQACARHARSTREAAGAIM